MPFFQAVFLDIDNTLLDFDAYVRFALAEGSRRLGLPPYRPELYGAFVKINSELWHRIERGRLDLEGLRKIRFPMILEEMGYEGDGAAFEELFGAALNDCAIPVEGALDLVKNLAERTILCAASNGPLYQQVNRLRLSGMLDSFSHVFVSEQIGCSKPSAGFFDACFQQLNQNGMKTVDPRHCLMVGDSLSSDVAGAAAYGMKTCYFDYYHKGIPSESRVKPDYVAESLAEVSAIPED